MALMNTFRRGNTRRVEPAEFMEWIEQVANASGATSLHGKAAKYAGLLVESECYETAELLASVTEQQLIAINVPRGHAAVLAYFLSGPPTQGASPSTSHGDSGGTTTTSEATNISGQMIGEIITATTRANKQAKALPKLTKTEPTVSDFLAWAAKVAVDRQGIQDEISDAVWWISDNPSLLAEFQLKQVEFQVPEEEDRRFLKDILTAIPGSVRMRLKADRLGPAGRWSGFHHCKRWHPIT